MTAQTAENSAKSWVRGRRLPLTFLLLACVLAVGVGVYATFGVDGRRGSTVVQKSGHAGARGSAPRQGRADSGTRPLPWPFEGNPGAWRLSLPAPGPEFKVPAYPQDVPDGRLLATAYQYDSRIYERAQEGAHPMGIVRRGTVLRAQERVYGPGCEGAWYTLIGGGLVCTRHGFHITSAPPTLSVRQLPPELMEPLPFGYGKIKSGALRYYRIPTPKEEEEIRALQAQVDAARASSGGEEEASVPAVQWPEVAEAPLEGAYFAALDRIETAGTRRYYRTVRGRYLRLEDLELRKVPAMHGEVLGERWQLPLGFVHGDEPLALSRAGANVGVAEKHARFPVRGVSAGKVRAPGGVQLPRERVRVARAIPRPSEVSPDGRWVHVNLTEQTLVAYEGDTPVFATLVSSGLEEPEFATPDGLYRVREKHVSVTMNGPDPDVGRYEVEEVPWTQYYYESYALHGAYWHNNFGRVRSHGCTNLAPMDARWLFHWSDPEVPAGWHARRRAEGTHILFTREAQAQASPAL